MSELCYNPVCDALCTVVLYAGLALIVKMVVEHFWRKPLLDGLTDRHVLITGCDTGFGMLMARRLDGQGVPVFAGCLTQDGVTALRDSCSSRLTAFLCDVTDDESIRRAHELVCQKLPPNTGLWGVINNAGIMPTFGPAEWHTRKDFQRALEVNTLGMAQVSVTFLPLLQLERGRLVLTSSVMGRFAVPGSPTYVMSKFAVLGFTHALRLEQSPFGVNVISVQPGGHKTNLTSSDRVRQCGRDLWDRQSDAMKHKYGETYQHNMIEGGLLVVEKTASSDLSGVLDAYYHALFAKHPRADYLVGWDAYLYIIMSYMPHFITDLIAFEKPACPPSKK